MIVEVATKKEHSMDNLCNNEPDKIIVGIHGVGDQSDGETIQAIQRRFAREFDEPPGLSIGRLSTARDKNGVYCWSPACAPHVKLGFAEVYWADIPRKLATDGYRLEGASQWAKTIVERLSGNCSSAIFPIKNRIRTVRVLREMVEAVGVLKRLSFLAEKAGFFTFDLDRVLKDYVCDVQVVTEFAEERWKILQKFYDEMAKIHQRYPDAEIHIIAHSEGTVVSLLALLTALTANEGGYPWIRQVKTLVTLGSPLDKHYFLWPDLWSEFVRPDASLSNLDKINWKNYYDLGDPVGFKLDSIRTHLCTLGYPFTNNLSGEDEIGFCRYPLPGKAHTDYWGDDDLFAHIIREVIKTGMQEAAKRPQDEFLAKHVSVIAPYIVSFSAVYAGMSLLAHSILSYQSACFEITDLLVDALEPTIVVTILTVAIRILALKNARFSLAEVNTATITRLRLLGRVVVTVVIAVMFYLGMLHSGQDYCQCGNSTGSLAMIFLNGGIFIYLWWLATIMFDLTYVWQRYIRSEALGEMLRNICQKKSTSE